MKKFCTSMAALLCIAVLTLTVGVRVNAEDLLCSLTVQLADIGTKPDGVGIAVYQVAVLDESSNSLQKFLPITGLESMSEALSADNLNQAGNARKTAEELAEIAGTLDTFKADAQVDSNGQAVFTGLEPGIYLVMQSSGTDTYGTIQPFLAPLPYMEAETGEVIFQMEASPKAEKPVPPEEPETPKPETDKEDPKTGDDTQPLVWIAVMGVAVLGASAVIVKKRKQKNS